jgi:hypothetical protein
MGGGKFYVYEHWRPDKDVCFYVGKGKGRRASVMYGRGAHHERIQKKLASLGMCVEVRLVADSLTEKDAHKKEIERIAAWRSLSVSLVNKTAGGEGLSEPSAEIRAKLRSAKVGKQLSPEHKKKISDGTKKALADPEIRSRISASSRSPKMLALSKSLHLHVPRTKEHYEKIAVALRGKKLSPEHAEKARRASLGRVQTQEEIKKRREANTGKKRSAEFCALMSSLWPPERREAHRIATIAKNKARAALARDTNTEAV